MQIVVDRVEIPPRSSIGYGYGRDEAGSEVCFAAEPRYLHDIDFAFGDGKEVVVEIERWQLIGCA